MFGKFKKKLKNLINDFSGSDEEPKEDSKEEIKEENHEQEQLKEEPKENVKEDIETQKESEEKEKPTQLPKIQKEPEQETQEQEDKNKEADIEQKDKEEQPRQKQEQKKGFSFFEKTLSEQDLDNFLFDLELTLLENNVALEVSQKIINDLKQELLGKRVSRRKLKEIIYNTLKNSIKEILDIPKIDILKLSESKKPILITFIGFNGSGKTTTIAKIGKYLIDNNKSVVFAAADSFRSAAIEQLEEHGKNLNIKVIKQKYGADPAAIIYDALNYAKAKGIDYVLADTAGRVHTDENLIRELEKIIKVNNPDLKIFVAESIAGNDIVEQAKIFNKVGIDAIILTKSDVDEKGGTTLSLSYTLKKPILFYGTGQEYTDLKEFNLDEVLSNLLE